MLCIKFIDYIAFSGWLEEASGGFQVVFYVLGAAEIVACLIIAFDYYLIRHKYAQARSGDKNNHRKAKVTNMVTPVSSNDVTV